MTGAEILQLSDGDFWRTWRDLPQADKDAMDFEERTRCIERFRRLSPAQNSAPARSDTAPSDFDKPTIEFIGGELDKAVDAAEQALIRSEEAIYERGEMLVRVVRRPAISSRNFNRAAGAIGLVVVDAAYLVDALTRCATWLKPDSRGGVRRINCPDKVAVTYLSRVGHRNVPRLWAAVDAPTMRPDGTIIQEPGYDPATAILYDPGTVSYPRISERPSKAQADAALEVLEAAVATFPFVEQVDQSVAVAALISSLIRRSLPAAPLIGITAPVMASGKTLLGDVVAIIATGVPAAAMVHPHDEEEAGKLLLSVLAEGEAVVLIDNVERPLEGAWLCAAVTSESYSARLLGRNATAKVPTSCTWIATGNSLSVAGDLRTRALLCRLDPRCERPEERTFQGDLREQMVARRPELVAAGLTVARAFLVSGTPAADVVRPWGRFEMWSERVRAPLVWLGRADPCASLAQLEREDPERLRLLGMLLAWREAFGKVAATARDFVTQAIGNTVLREAVEPVARDRSGQIDALRLGRWLQTRAGRIVAGMEFERAGERQGVALWQVKGEPST